MSPLLETIRIENRQICNLSYHNERLHRSRQALFGCESEIRLEDHIVLPKMLSNAVHKCRVIYDQSIHRIEFHSYQIKPIRTLRLIEDDALDYAYKWLDRSRLQMHIANAKADDILIVKNGLLTDTSYANIAFFDGVQWLTPATPLLAGTRRQQLLEQGVIAEEAELKPSDLKQFKFAKLMNAMLTWAESPVISVENIRF
jgi:4-amino-4-deoxychorismate lyase